MEYVLQRREHTKSILTTHKTNRVLVKYSLLRKIDTVL